MKQGGASRRKWLLAVGIILLLGLPLLVWAQGTYLLNWFTVDGGGGTATGANYTLQGTTGQHDAGQLSGGNYDLAGGFWGLPEPTSAPTATATPVPKPQYWLYLPLVIK